MSKKVFLKCQTPTVRIPVVAVSPDAEDKLTVEFKRYDTEVAQEKLSSFDKGRHVEGKIDAKAADEFAATVLFSEIVDIDGLEDAEGNVIVYRDLDDEDRKAVYKALHTSNPYIVAIIGGYHKALINIGEARSKNS